MATAIEAAETIRDRMGSQSPSFVYSVSVDPKRMECTIEVALHSGVEAVTVPSGATNAEIPLSAAWTTQTPFSAART